jgi:oxygen-independent coproporphyrinogen-3 oxidase
MAGIYIHIPFCRDACHYCDFHFAISYSKADEMVDAICREISLRKSYLDQQELNTIYFGGGTPSSLPVSKISQIIETVYANHPVSDQPEITLEANPDDLDPDYINNIQKAGVNRLSIGVQSFINEDLQWMNRTHNSSQAETCIGLCQKAGFSNLNVDLIYGLPGQTAEKWVSNINKIIELNVPHISAYHLTYEPGTVINYKKEKRKLEELNEDDSIEQFQVLISHLNRAGFIHYEISNFAREGFFSKHNLGYWNQEPYIGIGPSSHSYNGISRQWNHPRNRSYISSMHENRDFFEIEILTSDIKFHEYIMTSLRTKWGTDLDYIKRIFGDKHLNHILEKSYQYVISGDMIREEEKIILTDKGKLISDFIMQDMFL